MAFMHTCSSAVSLLTLGLLIGPDGGGNRHNVAQAVLLEQLPNAVYRECCRGARAQANNHATFDVLHCPVCRLLLQLILRPGAQALVLSIMPILKFVCKTVLSLQAAPWLLSHIKHTWLSFVVIATAALGAALDENALRRRSCTGLPGNGARTGTARRAATMITATLHTSHSCASTCFAESETLA